MTANWQSLPLACFAMSLQAVSDDRIVRVRGIPIRVRCYDPETCDVLVVEPTDHSFDPAAPGMFETSQVRTLHRKDEYQPNDDPSSWPVDGPCAYPPNA
jgi:hypothetical protein